MKWFLLFGILLLAVTTRFLLTHIDRFYVSHEQQLSDPAFLAGDHYWKQRGSGAATHTGNILRIENNDKASHSVFQKVFVSTPGYFRFTFEAAAEDIIPTDKSWAGGSGAIIYWSKAGERLGSRNVILLKADSSYKTYSRIEYLTKEIGSVDIAFRLLRAGGSLLVHAPRLSVMQEFPLYTKIKYGIAMTWLLVAAGLMFLSLSLLSSGKLVALLGLVGVSLVGVLMPEAIISGINLALSQWLPDSFLASAAMAMHKVFGVTGLSGPGAVVSKLGHLVLFVLMGIAVGIGFRKIDVFFSVTCIGVFAWVTETLQTLVNGRTFSVFDFYIDIAGGLIGVFIGVSSAFIYCVIARNFKS